MHEHLKLLNITVKLNKSLPASEAHFHTDQLCYEKCIKWLIPCLHLEAHLQSWEN